MHSLLLAGAVIAASLSSVSANGCAEGTTVNDGGNYYCSDSVDSITYLNVGGSGSYNKVTSMDLTSGTCSSEPYSFDGPLAPLNDDLSLHFRGPLHLKKLAVYQKGSTPSKRDLKPSFAERRHANHQRFHARAEDKRAVGDIVTATINDASKDTSGTLQSVNKKQASSTPKKAANITPGEWGRTAFYDAEAGTADGLTFLNHMGGKGSGKWTGTFGNSLAYASPDLTTGSSSPTVLEDKLIPDNNEMIIMSDKKCDGDCGGVFADDVAYRGFDGESKIFLAELKMPLSGQSGFNGDMPAFWILNAQIPRTMQYGKQECSCWASGCGEFDVLEVLDSGDLRCKSTLHAKRAGGDSHYISRPTDDFMKVAVVFNADSNSIHIKVLDKSVEFTPSLATSVVEDFCKDAGKSSTFTIAG